MKLLGIGLIMSTLFKAIYRLSKVIIMAIAHVLLYFGLWVPSIYMIVALIPIIKFDLDITVMSVDSFIFYLGLVLSLVAAIALSIRNMVVKPVKDLINYKKRKIEFRSRKELAKRRELYRKNPGKYFAIYGEALPHTDSELLQLSQKERGELPYETPQIYRSNVNYDIIIHEYSEYFDVFRDMGDHIEYIERKKKPKKVQKKSKK